MRFFKPPKSPTWKIFDLSKRRIVIYPAGVHIADFTSLLKLMAAFMDIVIGMYNKFRDFFFRYLIQYLFHSYHLPRVTPEGSS